MPAFANDVIFVSCVMCVCMWRCACLRARLHHCLESGERTHQHKTCKVKFKIRLVESCVRVPLCVCFTSVFAIILHMNYGRCGCALLTTHRHSIMLLSFPHFSLFLSIPADAFVYAYCLSFAVFGHRQPVPRESVVCVCRKRINFRL